MSASGSPVIKLLLVTGRPAPRVEPALTFAPVARFAVEVAVSAVSPAEFVWALLSDVAVSVAVVDRLVAPDRLAPFRPVVLSFVGY